MEFKDRLRKARIKSGLSGAALGKQIGEGVSRQLVNHWEKGRNAPDLAQLQRLCQVLNESADWLVMGREKGSQLSPDAQALGEHYDTLEPAEQERYGATLALIRGLPGKPWGYKKSPRDREHHTATKKKES